MLAVRQKRPLATNSRQRLFSLEKAFVSTNTHSHTLSLSHQHAWTFFPLVETARPMKSAKTNKHASKLQLSHDFANWNQCPNNLCLRLITNNLTRSLGWRQRHPRQCWFSAASHPQIPSHLLFIKGIRSVDWFCFPNLTTWVFFIKIYFKRTNICADLCKNDNPCRFIPHCNFRVT